MFHLSFFFASRLGIAGTVVALFFCRVVSRVVFHFAHFFGIAGGGLVGRFKLGFGNFFCPFGFGYANVLRIVFQGIAFIAIGFVGAGDSILLCFVFVLRQGEGRV